MRIGTRGSALALAQARWVAERLGDEAQIVTIATAGDRGAPGGDKSRWVAELERALLEGEIDLAVHSAKDVPAALPEGLDLVAVPTRAEARDVLCGASGLGALPAGARVGTSSLRRSAQLRALREDLDVVPVRGNVDTRLTKLHHGQVDALVLAQAGLARLGRAGEAGGLLDELVPAPGQGALALEAVSGRVPPAMLGGLRDPASTACLSAERELVTILGASCHTPVGAHAVVVGHSSPVSSGGYPPPSGSPQPRRGRPPAGGGAPALLELRAWVGLPDGSAWVSDCLRGPPAGLGAEVARRLLAVGAGELLAQAEGQVAAP